MTLSGFYAIADAGFGDPVALGFALLRAGPCALQVRCKGWPPERVRPVLEALHPACRERGVPLIVNDHAALAPWADGVHLGQEDGAFRREALPPGCLVGRSTHDLVQVAAACAEGVDLVGFGPVWATRTRPGAGRARGPQALARAVEAATVPVVAIGGIGPGRVAACRRAGAAAFTALSAVLGRPDPTAAARGLLAEWEAAGDDPSSPGRGAQGVEDCP